MTIGELNTRITVTKYTTMQNAETGRISEEQTGNFICWAKVEQTSSSRTLDNSAVKYSEVYKITVQRQGSNLIKNGDKITYKNRVFTVHSVKTLNEGRATFDEITAYI